MSITRSFRLIAAVIAILGVAPAIAEAHHVDEGGATCALEQNVPTIRASARFVHFGDWNKPVSGALTVDRSPVETVTGLSWPGTDHVWRSALHQTSSGVHRVYGEFSWPHQGGEQSWFAAQVYCPAPQPQPRGHISGGGGKCVLVNNVPTLSAWFRFEGFARNEKPVGGVFYNFAESMTRPAEVIHGFTFPGTAGTWHSRPRAARPGVNEVAANFEWPRMGDRNRGHHEFNVGCPKPKPTPKPTPKPEPVPPVPPKPAPRPVKPAPVGLPVAPQPVDVKQPEAISLDRACVAPYRASRYRITVSPGHARHGLVRFRLHGPARHVRWSIRGRRVRHGRWTHAHGRTLTSYLFDRGVWTRQNIYGHYRVSARFRAGCGWRRVTLDYLNLDPPPGVRVAHSSRSSWS